MLHSSFSLAQPEIGSSGSCYAAAVAGPCPPLVESCSGSLDAMSAGRLSISIFIRVRYAFDAIRNAEIDSQLCLLEPKGRITPRR